MPNSPTVVKLTEKITIKVVGCITSVSFHTTKYILNVRQWPYAKNKRTVLIGHISISEFEETPSEFDRQVHRQRHHGRCVDEMSMAIEPSKNI